MYKQMIFEFFLQNFQCRCHTGAKKLFTLSTLLTLKMAIFWLKMSKIGSFRIKNYYFCLLTYEITLEEFLVILGCAYSVKLVNYQLIFWIFPLKNGHFQAENGPKMVFYGKKLPIFFAQHIRQCLMSTQIMWLGLHCKIDEVRVNLSFFSNRGKIDVDFQKTREV